VRLDEITDRQEPGSVVRLAIVAGLEDLEGSTSASSSYGRPVMVGYRTGMGHDIHRLVPGKKLVLGGVTIPADVGFETHSDGDVLCYALIDALAGAIADGDLGTHFPEDDPDAEDARSLDFVREFARHVRAAGFSVRNVDAFVVLGPIRLRPHIASMRANLADALGLDESAVSVKARSNDGLGPEGEGTACAAWANVLVYPSGPP
jgi:2-C-methyl-D-erythritol 2,4-cyclodiphosphate synthase